MGTRPESETKLFPAKPEVLLNEISDVQKLIREDGSADLVQHRLDSIAKMVSLLQV